jgi:hypothetical protein
MKLRNRDNYSTPEARKRLVIFLSHTIEGRAYPDNSFAPYKPNETDDMFWTLDSGNNWKVKFHADEPQVFEIIYRYQCAGNPYEEALAAWLAVRIHTQPA